MFSTVAFTALLALLSVPHLSVAEESVPDPGTSGTFEVSAGNQAVFQAPPGVRTISYELVGGRGGNSGPIAGGKPAKVTGNYEFDPSSSGTLYAEAGTNAEGKTGGSNGGGSALTLGENSLPGYPFITGGGGGGASDLRTQEPASTGSLISRVAIAGGGGGAGATGHGPTPAGAGGAGGTAGAAPAAGSDGVAVSNPPVFATAALGGGSGGSSTGGTAGAGGVMSHSTWNGTSGTAGGHGLGGTGGGGNGGRAVAGGGGLWGGGGGGGGASVTGGDGFSPLRASGGAGGGAGSSLAPNGTIVTDPDSITVPRVSISYATPGTTIESGPADVITSAEAQFTFSSSDTGSTFTCTLDSGTPEACSSPLNLTDLPEGAHTFEVFATEPGGNFDGTPAKWEFSVDTTAPVVKVTGGPEGKTRDLRPTFNFTVDEAGATAECRFDSSEFGDCDGSGTHRPDTDLAAGFHSFEVRATDLAGNTGPAANRGFEVDLTSEPGPVAKLTFGKPVFNKKTGSAWLPVRSNFAGKVTLRPTRAIKPQKGAIRAGQPLKLKVGARGKALRKLRRKGKLKVTTTIRFTAPSVGSVTKTRKLTLRLTR